jgi:DnaJ family protein C protein 2
VFLKVKAAFETLTTSKTAYDSTEMPFDDSLPSESPSDFFKEYQPVFERNMHFDAKLLPSNKQNNNGSGKKKKNSKKNKNNNNHRDGPPELGDINTSIEEVHEFYDYWTHFDSWRDFTLQAARELETEDHVENAESRYEKRWYQKEIDRHAKKLKQLEVARITALVERAMAADPRLIQERKRLIEEKERKQREREQDAINKKKQEKEAQLAEERRIEEEKKRKADEKLQREKEKKLFRKTKQTFRRYVGDALQELLEKEFALEEEVDLICAEMERIELTSFNTKLDTQSASEIVQTVKKKAADLRDGVKDENDDGNNNTNSEKTSSDDTSGQQTSSSTITKAKVPFTKEELSALAKGVKKFPPGGANRWDAIANYINNLCRPEDPRTKEECIETFNQINKSAKAQRNGAVVGGGSNSVLLKPSETPTTTTPPATAPADSTNTSTAAIDTGGWTAEEDQQLQNGLAKYPATMDKNERWTKIATEVPGKSKKDCVQRFKEIRNAIKATKK